MQKYCNLSQNVKEYWSFPRCLTVCIKVGHHQNNRAELAPVAQGGSQGSLRLVCGQYGPSILDESRVLQHAIVLLANSNGSSCMEGYLQSRSKAFKAEARKMCSSISDSQRSG